MNPLINSKYFFFVLTLIFISTLNAQSNNQEFRATWVITWEHISSGSTVEQNKARVREILDNHQKANMTSVLFQVRQGGTAYYESSYEPWGSYAGYSYPGYDPLEYAVEEAHKRGLELHAWFNVFSVSSTHSGTIADEHPEWICRDENGNPMTAYRAASPGLAAVRDYTIDVAMEIVRNYDIDGLHLDYVRWNEYDTDDMTDPMTPLEQESKLDGFFSKERINKFNSVTSTNRFIYDVEHPFSYGVPSGFSTWEDWRRWSVTEFVKTLHDSIQAVKPWVRLSPAALGKYKTGGTSGWNG
ncbi:MAG: family 10 glycosylhydrolase, partial [Candidatus Heimdallarchaeota archaeon]|nr:family 10 glycosylhydrolase [Candidatus Heimdallarchaeota archaeon]